MATAFQCRMRRFALERSEDVSGTSGTGTVAEGVLFSAGHVSLTWLSPLWTVSSYQSMEALLIIHGHGGKTRVRWIDAPDETLSPLLPTRTPCQHNWVLDGHNAGEPVCTKCGAREP